MESMLTICKEKHCLIINNSTQEVCYNFPFLIFVLTPLSCLEDAGVLGVTLVNINLFEVNMLDI